MNLTSVQKDFYLFENPNFLEIHNSYYSKNNKNSQSFQKNAKLSNYINNAKFTTIKKYTKDRGDLNYYPQISNFSNMYQYLNTYEENLIDWENKLDIITADLTQRFYNSTYSFKLLKLQKIEETFKNFSSNTMILKSSSLNSKNFDDLMQDLDVSLKIFYQKIKYVHDYRRNEITSLKEILNNLEKLKSHENHWNRRICAVYPGVVDQSLPPLQSR
jgi:hypothetical protein